LKTIKLSDGDLVFEKGDFQLIEGMEEIQQCTEIILGTNKKEWFLNPDFGIDFNNLREKATDNMIENEIIEGVAQEPRIEFLETIEVIRNKPTRKASVYFEAQLTTGEVLESEVTVNA
jgi:phage baseplate assembly protein W